MKSDDLNDWPQARDCSLFPILVKQLVRFKSQSTNRLKFHLFYSQTRSSVLPKNQDLVLLFKI